MGLFVRRKIWSKFDWVSYHISRWFCSFCFQVLNGSIHNHFSNILFIENWDQGYLRLMYTLTVILSWKQDQLWNHWKKLPLGGVLVRCVEVERHIYCHLHLFLEQYSGLCEKKYKEPHMSIHCSLPLDWRYVMLQTPAAFTSPSRWVICLETVCQKSMLTPLSCPCHGMCLSQCF